MPEWHESESQRVRHIVSYSAKKLWEDCNARSAPKSLFGCRTICLECFQCYVLCSYVMIDCCLTMISCTFQLMVALINHLLTYLLTYRATFDRRLIHGLLFGWSLWMYWPNLKSVAFPVPEIIRGTQKCAQSLDMRTLPFVQNFNGLSFRCTLWMYLPNLKFVALPAPGIIVYQLL